MSGNTIADIVRNGKGKAGSNHSWEVTLSSWGSNRGSNIRILWHYSTPMLVWDFSTNKILEYYLGNGSVSDQKGMNTAFRVLGSHLYFSRMGGAHIR